MAHSVVDLILYLFTDLPDVVERMQGLRMRESLLGCCCWKYMSSIENSLPAFKAFLLAARRVNITKLAEFVGRDVCWIHFMFCRWILALEEVEGCLTSLGDEREISSLKRNRHLWNLGRQLKLMHGLLFDVNKAWLSRQEYTQDMNLVQPVSWKTIWLTSAKALDYLSTKDSAWFEVKSKLAAWGNGRFDTRLTLDIIMEEDKEAYDNTHVVLVNAFNYILVYGGKA